MKKVIKNLVITLIGGVILYYFTLPALNIQSIGFWMYILALVSIYTFSSFCMSINIHTGAISNVSRRNYYPLLVIVGIFIIIGITNIICSPVFNSKSYSKRIMIDETKDFSSDVALVDFDHIPLLDKDSSSKLGDRVMGELPEMVSQFRVSEMYTQINYNNSIIRVTPLEYNGFFKYLSNKSEGVAGYITVDSTNGSAKLTELEKGMKYVDSAYFGKDLKRHLRFNYPTKIFGEAIFEIDNEGSPFFIVPTKKYTAFGLKEEISGVVILNPIDGTSKYYEVSDVPKWVDHVFDANLIIEQVDDWGLYTNGFINSFFSQKNVVMTTDGYNYIAQDDDIYLYTGITSVASDESNIGFILTNMRTKETNYYAVSGAEEYSAMSSAEGQVQQMKYKATFPLLINLDGEPTYLISLKDNAGLVKMYAFVNVKNYQLVTVTDASKGIIKASENYLNTTSENIVSDKLLTKDIAIKKINSAVIDGITYYYIIDNDNKYYRVNIKVSNKLPFISINDKLTISYSHETEITEIKEIK